MLDRIPHDRAETERLGIVDTRIRILRVKAEVVEWHDTGFVWLVLNSDQLRAIVHGVGPGADLTYLEDLCDCQARSKVTRTDKNA